MSDPETKYGDPDIKYTITFPRFVREEATSKGEDTFSYFSKQKDLPIIVLFGWLGCKDEHLEKYSFIYENQGFTTLRFTSQNPLLTVKLWRLPVLANKFLDYIKARGIEDRPFIIHVFSNTGAIYYQELSLQMQKQNRTLPIKGVIFDSAPHNDFTVYRVYLLVKNLIFGDAWYSSLPSMLIGVIMWIYLRIWALVKALINFKKPEPFGVFLDEEPYSWPQMFIYSKDDDLNPWKRVEKFIQRREERGVRVTKLCFENSPHVKHLTTHREVYMNAVVHFAQTFLSTKSSKL